jgi:hypothetical protein
MVGVSKFLSRKPVQFLLLAASALIAVHLSYDSYATEGNGEIYIVVIGLCGLLIGLFLLLAHFNNE